MSDKYKILSQVSVSSATNTVIYSVPAIASKSYGSVEVSPKAVSSNIQTLLTSVVLSFDGTGSVIEGDIELSNEGSAYAKFICNLGFYDRQNSLMNLNLTMSPDSAVRFSPSLYTGSGTLYITAYGVELETGYGPS